MPSLKVLSVCSCGLTELFGADFLVNLTGDHLNVPAHSPSELYAARNSINNVTDLSDLTKLKILDMEKWVEFKRLESDVISVSATTSTPLTRSASSTFAQRCRRSPLGGTPLPMHQTIKKESTDTFPGDCNFIARLLF